MQAMSKYMEQSLRRQLKFELSNIKSHQPSSEQDAIFQENLERFSSQCSSRDSLVQPFWYIAAMLLISIGFAVHIGKNYINFNSIDTKHGMTIAELIAASNQVESEIASIESTHDNSSQYIEVLKIREDLGELDNKINELYQSGVTRSKDDIQALWHKRLEMARHLKGLYTNQYEMARI